MPERDSRRTDTDTRDARALLASDARLLELATVARARLGARLGYLEAGAPAGGMAGMVTLGRRPAWWVDDWTPPRRPHPALRR